MDNTNQDSTAKPSEKAIKSQDESPLEEKILLRSQEDELLLGINKSLGEQVTNEMSNNEKEPFTKRKAKLPFRVKVSFGIIGAILLCFALLLVTPFGRNFLWDIATDYAYGKMSYDDGQAVVKQEESIDLDKDLGNTPVISSITTPPQIQEASTDVDLPRKEEGIVNVLLLGEEAIDSGTARGRTDIMMIGTMNTMDKSLKLTSLMRDMLVQIPGYKDNKLNTAYEMGGIPLLYQTIELNFDIHLDGYILVGFDAFEDIINKLGGVSITLTGAEAEYLNTTNYISKPEYRNVSPGLITLNGNQALGYCRIRYVATNDHQLNDFGRTSRQRVVLNSIFDKYKAKSLPQLVLCLNDLLPLITTDINKDDFSEYLKLGVTMNLNNIENFRLPADHTFEEGSVRGMSVLIPDLQKNVNALHEYIFGNVKE
ncbi:MAG: cell envelope-related transcriptional attenuator [Anaerocolumna sp.]|nr:cell envelope-related transcriptional attenuator [Anaerocolumna sp.]